MANFSYFPQTKSCESSERKYPGELDRLKTAYSIPVPTSKRPGTPSPSMSLYGAEFDEIDRTLLRMLAFSWIYNRDYASFVGNQPLDSRLTSQSFDWIVTIFHSGIKNSNDLYFLITSTIINDLGKSQTLASEYCSTAEVDISNLNHDMVLYQSRQNQRDLIPSFARFQSADRVDLITGIKLEAEFNYGQLAQVENVPASRLVYRR